MNRRAETGFAPPPQADGSEPVKDLRAAPALDESLFASIRRRSALQGCKWDPQIGDVEALAPFPLVLKRSAWKRLAAWAESLTAEASLAEEEIVRRPELLDSLGLPPALRSVLAEPTPLTPAAGRVIRFDFHFTTEGWRISEANSDVPGGYSEASHFTGLMAEHYPGLVPAGDPAGAWSDVLAATAGRGGNIVLLSAPGFMEDHQVVAFLAGKLSDRGCRTHLAKPEQIRWYDGTAHLQTAWHHGPVDAIVRFYQAEWLATAPSTPDWRYFFRGGTTPVANPPLAVISESKRFPLVWARLVTKMNTWGKLLPTTREPRVVPWLGDDGWLLKTALCNTGDTVSMRAWMPPYDWLRTRWSAALNPGDWIAQRRFESVPVATSAGLRHACVGVYTVDGRAAGAYARLSRKPLIDFAAVDVALLLDDDE